MVLQSRKGHVFVSILSGEPEAVGDRIPSRKRMKIVVAFVIELVKESVALNLVGFAALIVSWVAVEPVENLVGFVGFAANSATIEPVENLVGFVGFAVH